MESSDVNNKINVFKTGLETHWHWVLGGIVVFVILLMWYYRVDKFIAAQVDSKLPYSSGSTLRVLSELSGTNQGRNNIWRNL